MSSRDESDRRAELTERLDVLLTMADEIVAEIRQVDAEDGNPAQRRQRLRVVR